MCTIGKNENKYIREFVEHYKNYGVDKIILYDNNDLNNNIENYEDILSDYIKKDFIEIINYRGKNRAQLQSYNDCYEKKNEIFNWLIFYDIDEFIYLRNFKNLKLFLNQNKFSKCEAVQLNWVFHSDNNLIYYDNRTLAKRFPNRKPQEIGQKKGGSKGIKTIIRGKIKINITDIHALSTNIRSCDGFGNIRNSNSKIVISDLYYFYIDHYYCKSTEEFIQKITKTDAYHILTDHLKYLKLEVYFSINNITNEKLDYIEKETKLNLSKFRKKIA